MSIRGAIYFKPAFKFPDGSRSDKLMVLLNTPSKTDDYLFVPTTSQKKIRSNSPGCVRHYGAGEFFIPIGTSAFFNSDTWIILAEIFPISRKTIQTDPEYTKMKGTALPSKLMDKVIACLFKHHSDDIPEMYEPLIRPKITDWTLQLAGRYNT